MAQNEISTLGGGCFWCVEAVFQRIEGVISVKPGYAGGKTLNPTYKEICTGKTGHAEVAQITYDPKIVTFKQILDVFWVSHDPTTLNRQGPNIGHQYRSEIFYQTDKEKESAHKVLDEVNNKLNGKVVTVIRKEKNYCKAEEYHQKYFEKRSKR